MSQQFKHGDKVRVTFEGKVGAPSLSSGRTLIDVKGFVHSIDLNSGDYAVELVEPEYAEGEFYRDANDLTWVRSDGAWRLCGATGYYPTHIPSRPLVRLVPEQR